MKRINEVGQYLSFLPFMALSVVAENGPSWKTVASAACGGAVAILTATGGYMFAQQTKVDERQDSVISAVQNVLIDMRVMIAGQTATISSQKAAMDTMKEQLDYERKRREQREDQERADLRATQGQKK